MSVKLGSKQLEEAAHLVAEDRLPDKEIAARVGITERQLNRWKLEPVFSARVQEIVTEFAKRVTTRGIARKARRIEVLNDLHEKVLTVIDERAKDPALQSVPGGTTGLVTKTLKSIGSGDSQQVVEEHALDTGLIREIRGIQDQVAKEVGQRVERHEVNVNYLFSRMSPEELEAYASTGFLPEWFRNKLKQQEDANVS